MDIPLEIFDQLAGDGFYKWLLPQSEVSAELSYGLHNATQSLGARWQYRPSTHLLYLEPSPAAYESGWTRDNIYRQSISIFVLTWFFGLLNYFVFSSLSYICFFDKSTFKHPKFVKNQIRQEIKQALIAMPTMAVPTGALFLLEVRGYTKLYDMSADGPGLWYDWMQVPIFIFFTDSLIYWIHRGLHHPMIYKSLHKPHHRWIMPSPYASYAFHPMDGFAQSAPYHIYPMIFPMHKLLFVAAFLFVNLWAILIHDGEYISDNPVINGSACHSAHHLYFNYNYGQFTTLWDRLGGTYRKPERAWFDRSTKMTQSTWKSDIREMEKIQKDVEGKDDRTYDTTSTKKNI